MFQCGCYNGYNGSGRLSAVMIERLRQDKTFNWIGDLEIRESSSERERREQLRTLHVFTENKENKICVAMWMCAAVDVFLMYASVAVVRFNKESSARVPVSAYQHVTSPCQYCQYTTLHSPVAIWANCTKTFTTSHNKVSCYYSTLLETSLKSKRYTMETGHVMF